MIKEWNKTGKLKALLILIASVLNLFFPIQIEMQHSYTASILIPLLFSVISIPLFTKINQGIKKETIIIPKWNDPLNGKNKFVFHQFSSCFFLGVGTCMLIGHLIRFHNFHKLAIISIFFGIGIQLGSRIAILWLKNEDEF